VDLAAKQRVIRSVSGTRAAGVEVKVVYVADTATAPDVASAMEAAGASGADVVAAGIPIQNCINMYDAIQSLGDPIVVTTASATTPR